MGREKIGANMVLLGAPFHAGVIQAGGALGVAPAPTPASCRLFCSLVLLTSISASRKFNKTTSHVTGLSP